MSGSFLRLSLNCWVDFFSLLEIRACVLVSLELVTLDAKVQYQSFPSLARNGKPNGSRPMWGSSLALAFGACADRPALLKLHASASSPSNLSLRSTGVSRPGLMYSDSHRWEDVCLLHLRNFEQNQSSPI